MILSLNIFCAIPQGEALRFSAIHPSLAFIWNPADFPAEIPDLTEENAASAKTYLSLESVPEVPNHIIVLQCISEKITEKRFLFKCMYMIIPIGYGLISKIKLKIT